MIYCADPFCYKRRISREVMIGRVGVGGAHPIRVQSMITCDTMDTEASIQQTMELAAAGCEIVRITAPTVKDARNLEQIKRGLLARGCDVPIVADIHFKPDAAMEAAKWVDKVRINPGNYADSKKFAIREYSDEQYAAELSRIRERFTPLVTLCKERAIAMRIGTNHGSLSDRIMNRYGDSPLGMVESALEFAQIARELGVETVVEGSVIRSGGRVKVTAELINAKNDQHLWAQTYERNLEDVLTVQRDIARAVASKIQIELTPEASARLEEQPRRVDAKAYDAFVRGRYYVARATAADRAKAVEQFQQALDADPTYAPSYGGLAEAYAQIGYNNDLAPNDSFPKGKASAARALELDPNLSEAHASLGFIHMYYDWDWPSTEREFRRALFQAQARRRPRATGPAQRRP